MSGIGGYVHDDLSLQRLESAFQARGAWTLRQARAGVGRHCGHIDLLILIHGHRIAIEIELSAKRIGNDLNKAKIANADELWLIAPTRQIANSISRKLKCLHDQMPSCKIVILTLGQALQRIESSFPLFFGANITEENK